MFTESNENRKEWWPADFRLVHRATFGRELTLELVVTNTGTTPLRFEEAPHAYHRVGNIKKAKVRGLDAVHYLDKTDSNREKVQSGEIVISGETDRVYLNTSDLIELEDPVLPESGAFKASRDASGLVIRAQKAPFAVSP